MFIYVGKSNFKSDPDGQSPNDGVAVFDFDQKTGAFAHVETITGLRNPSYLAKHPQQPVLYVIERKADCVVAFSIDKQTGKLKEMGRKPIGGLSPVHIRLHSSGRYAVFANPGKHKDPDPPEGHVTVMRLADDGSLGEVCASEKYRGEAPTWRSRPNPYPHNISADPQWKRLFVTFLMLDRVLVYHFDEKTGTLRPSEQPYVQVSSGAGARQVAFHPSGRYFHIINEFDATVSTFAYDAEAGTAGIVDTVSFHPEGFTGKKNGTHIVVGPGAKFVYCSSRTYQNISVFSIDATTGRLRLVSRHETLGNRPRDFVFDPSGRFLVVTNQTGNTVVSFHVDPETGGLSPTGHSIETFAPNCVVF